jgi:gamma-glutamyltranspeptidase/glutathione hydrolase
MPVRGMETITVPGAFDGWVTLLNRYGTMKLADLLQPAIEYAENGFPVMEKAAEDWAADADALKNDPAASATYLPAGTAPRAGDLFRNPHLAHTLRVLAQGGRDAFYTGEIGRAIVEYAQKHGGFLTADDLAAQHSEWVKPISTTYRGYTVYECPPNGQGLTALLALNILEGSDLKSLRSDPAQYYHLLIEATKVAFVDRNRYIADPKFVNVPVTQLLDKNYAAQRRQLINANAAIEPPQPGLPLRHGETTYFTVVDKDRNAVSFINSLYEHWGSGIVAGDTGIVLQDRGSAFSLDPQSPNVIAPGKRPFHTIIPAMVFKDGKLFMSFGVMGGAMQAQGHVQVLTNMIDLGMDVQQAIETPRFRYDGDKRVILEPEMGENVISALEAKGHQRIYANRNVRTFMGGGQAIVVDWQHGTLEGGSDPRKDGMALGW